MSLEWSINGLEQTGDPTDKTRAAVLRAILEERGEDIPMPGIVEEGRRSADEVTTAPVQQISMLILPSEAARLGTDVLALEDHYLDEQAFKQLVSDFLGLIPASELK